MRARRNASPVLLALRDTMIAVSLTDTSAAAQAVQLDILRGMTGEQRILLAFEMSDFARELAKEGIRREHPDWQEARVARELLRLAFLPAPLPAWMP
ncbi:MAG: hypothetical protein ACRD3P_14050 [Terriglobales bacterium]